MGHAGFVRPAQPWTKPPFVEVQTEKLSVPLPQFVGSANYQRLDNTRGFKHAIWGHMVNNALYSVVAIPKVRKMRREQN